MRVAKYVGVGMLVAGIALVAQPVSAGPIAFHSEMATTMIAGLADDAPRIDLGEDFALPVGPEMSATSFPWHDVSNVGRWAFTPENDWDFSYRDLGHTFVPGGSGGGQGESAQSVPEPTSLLLMALGIAGAAAARRRRVAHQ
jgi:hypothetical protein